MSNPKEDLRKIESILANLDDDLKDNQDIHQLSSTLVDFFNTTSCKALDSFIQLATSDEETCYDMQDSTETFSLFCGCSNVQKCSDISGMKKISDPDKTIVGIDDLPKVIETCGDAQYVLSLLPESFCPLDEVKEIAKFCGRKSKKKKLQKISKSICDTAGTIFFFDGVKPKECGQKCQHFPECTQFQVGKNKCFLFEGKKKAIKKGKMFKDYSCYKKN